MTDAPAIEPEEGALATEPEMLDVDIEQTLIIAGGTAGRANRGFIRGIKTATATGTISINAPNKVFRLGVSGALNVLLVGSNNGRLCIHDLEEFGLIHAVEHQHNGEVLALLATPDGRFVFTGDHAGNIAFFSTDTWELVKHFKAHGSGVAKLQNSVDGETFISVSYDGTCRVWSRESFQQVAEYRGHKGSVCSVVTLPLAPPMIVSGGEDRLLHVWDHSTGQLIRTINKHEDWIMRLSSSDHFPFFASGDDGGLVCLWTSDTLEVVWQVHFRDQLSAVTLSPDARHVLVCAGADPSHAELLDASNGTKVRQFYDFPGRIFACAFKPSLQRFAHIKGIAGFEGGFQ
eukprot:m.136509 g.136509  ORF g.136509 m.136509 type:complete len:346 (+) comp52475_c0_seq1:183-1220(+)